MVLNSKFLGLLLRKAGSKAGAEGAPDDARSNLGLPTRKRFEEALAAIALRTMGEHPEAVSKLLSWQEFERFVSHLLAAWEY